MPTWLYTTAGSHTCQSTQGRVWCIGGGGGGGGNQQASADGGGGGGGGACATSWITGWTPGGTKSYSLGTAGTGGINTTAATNGGDTTFDSTVVVAKGGALGSPGAGSSPGAGGAGGQSSTSTGDLKYNGGYGEDGLNSNNGRGGFGGSSAGLAAVGYLASGDSKTYSVAIYPTANTPAGGYHGGDGANSTSANGSAPASGFGGGGGGCSEGTTMRGGAGGTGVVMVYESPPAFLLCLGCG